MTPRPPRPWRGRSDSSTRFPCPISVTKRSRFSLSAGGSHPVHTTRPPSPTPTPTLESRGNVILAAGDNAMCGSEEASWTAAMMEVFPDDILLMGDISNDYGTVEQYADCFDPDWGRYKTRIHAVPGNHDYYSGGGPFYDYFGPAAGPAGVGYYSFDLYGWHIIGLNSNCDLVGGCAPDSTQYQWLVEDLNSHPAQCTLAFWHHPFFSSLIAGGSTNMFYFIQALYDAGADVVLNGHNHVYNRFLPMDPQGNVDLKRGLREFVAGTGGAWLQSDFVDPPEREVEISTWGLLRLELGEGYYRWSFYDTDLQLLDDGEGWCH